MKHLLTSLLFASCLTAARAATLSLTIQLDTIVPAGTGLVSGGTLLGSINYDEALVPPSGVATLYPEVDATLALSFELDGAAFDVTHDTAPNFPQLLFTNGLLTGINYYAANHHPASDSAGYVQIETSGAGTGFFYGFDSQDEFTGTVQWSAVPEPSSLTLCLLASGLVLRRRNRR